MVRNVKDKLTFLGILGMYFFIGMIYSLPAAFYTPYVINKKKETLILAAFIIAFFDLTNVIMSTFIYKALEKTSSSMIFHLGVFFSVAFNGIFGMLMNVPMNNDLYIILAMTLRLLMGGGVGMVFCTGSNMIAQVSGKHQVALISWAMSAVWLGDMLGPLVGGLMKDIIDDGYYIPFLTVSTLMLILQTVIVINSPNQIEEGKAPIVTIKDAYENWYQFVFHYKILLLLTASFIIAVGAGLLEVTYPLFLDEEFSYTSAQTALIFGIIPLCYAIVSPIVSFRCGSFPILTLGLSICFFCPGYGLLTVGHAYSGVTGATATMIVCFCLIGIGSALGQTPFYPYLLTMATERGFPENIETRTRIAALDNCVYAVGRMVGSIVFGGILSEYLPYKIPFLSVSLLYLAVYIVFFITHAKAVRARKSGEDQVAPGLENKPIMAQKYKEKLDPIPEDGIGTDLPDQS